MQRSVCVQGFVWRHFYFVNLFLFQDRWINAYLGLCTQGTKKYIYVRCSRQLFTSMPLLYTPLVLQSFYAQGNAYVYYCLQYEIGLSLAYSSYFSYRYSCRLPYFRVFYTLLLYFLYIATIIQITSTTLLFRSLDDSQSGKRQQL